MRRAAKVRVRVMTSVAKRVRDGDGEKLFVTRTRTRTEFVSKFLSGVSFSRRFARFVFVTTAVTAMRRRARLVRALASRVATRAARGTSRRGTFAAGALAARKSRISFRVVFRFRAHAGHDRGRPVIAFMLSTCD